MKIAAIIVNWNRYKDTVSTLESLGDTNLPKADTLEVIVVDNASTDSSPKILKILTRKIPNIKLIQSKVNLGYAGGNNLGIEYAQKNFNPDYYLILNNDLIFDKNFLNELLKTSQNQSADLVCPLIFFAKGYEYHKDRYSSSDLGKVVWYGGGKIDWDNIYTKHINVDKVYSNKLKFPTQINFACGAVLLIRKQVIEKIGGFDKKYFLYWEDADFSTRAIKSGFNIGFARSSKIWHKVSGSSGIGSNLNDYFLTRNRLLFGFRFASNTTKFALIRESIRQLFDAPKWQKQGVIDFYLKRFGKGSWK